MIKNGYTFKFISDNQSNNFQQKKAFQKLERL